MQTKSICWPTEASVLECVSVKKHVPDVPQKLNPRQWMPFSTSHNLAHSFAEFIFSYFLSLALGLTA